MKSKNLTIQTNYSENMSLRSILHEPEVDNIVLEHYRTKRNKTKGVSDEEFTSAIDTIITYFYERSIYKTTVDIDYRNKILTPGLKKMTMEDIEKALGHPVLLINEKTKELDINPDGVTTWLTTQELVDIMEKRAEEDESI